MHIINLQNPLKESSSQSHHFSCFHSTLYTIMVLYESQQNLGMDLKVNQFFPKPQWMLAIIALFNVFCEFHVVIHFQCLALALSSQGRAQPELPTVRDFQRQYGPGISLQFFQSGSYQVSQRLLHEWALRPQFSWLVSLSNEKKESLLQKRNAMHASTLRFQMWNVSCV